MVLNETAASDWDSRSRQRKKGNKYTDLIDIHLYTHLRTHTYTKRPRARKCTYTSVRACTNAQMYTHTGLIDIQLFVLQHSVCVGNSLQDVALPFTVCVYGLVSALPLLPQFAVFRTTPLEVSLNEITNKITLYVGHASILYKTCHCRMCRMCVKVPLLNV